MPHPDIDDDKSIIQTEGTDDQGNPDYSIQFFVSTQDYEGPDASHKIRIEVEGLIPHQR